MNVYDSIKLVAISLTTGVITALAVTYIIRHIETKTDLLSEEQPPQILII